MHNSSFLRSIFFLEHTIFNKWIATLLRWFMWAKNNPILLPGISMVLARCICKVSIDKKKIDWSFEIISFLVLLNQKSFHVLMPLKNSRLYWFDNSLFEITFLISFQNYWVWYFRGCFILVHSLDSPGAVEPVQNWVCKSLKSPKKVGAQNLQLI